MARETSYFVQSFNTGKGANLKADAPISCKSETGALRAGTVNAALVSRNQPSLHFDGGSMHAGRTCLRS
jgi:hypothetical protein